MIIIDIVGATRGSAMKLASHAVVLVKERRAGGTALRRAVFPIGNFPVTVAGAGPTRTDGCVVVKSNLLDITAGMMNADRIGRG
jgi:hypothetical protein